MHELGVIRQIVRSVEAFAQENKISEIEGIVLEIGELSLVIPEYVEKLYPVAIEGTILQHAKLEIVIIPGMAECNECDEIFNVIETEGYCPNCNSFDKDVLTGKDLLIKQLLVNDTVPETGVNA